MSEQLIKFDASSMGERHIEAKLFGGYDERTVIYGVVIDDNNRPVSNAVVKLILLEDPSDPRSLIPVTHSFTDEYGQFLFGPLPPNNTYLIKVWYDDIFVRKIVVKPDKVRHSCITIRNGTALVHEKKVIPINHSEK